MKQFSGLYPQYSMSKFPISSAGISQSSINKSSSNRNIIKISNPPKKKQTKPLNNAHTNHKTNTQIKQIPMRQRLSRSIQEIPHLESDDSIGSLFGNRKTFAKKDNGVGKNGKEILIQNCEDSQENNEKDNNEFFSQPYNKLSKVYHNFDLHQSRNGIQEQLAQILQLIKQQRTVIRNKLAQIQSKKSKKQCQTTECGQNTQSIITTNTQIQTKQVQIQTQPTQSQQRIEGNQTYIKLIKILQDMKINSKLILPKDVDVKEIKSSNNEDSKYQELKESEIITVQKFVIKKLVQKITSLEEGKDV